MTLSFRSRYRGAVGLTAFMVVLWASAPGWAADWVKVGEGSLRGVSGMALLSHQAEKTELLVVHDSKGAGEPRLGVLIVGPGKVDYLGLAWPDGGTLPADLESVSSIPDRPGHFLAVTSRGQVFPLTVSGAGVAVQPDFLLPNLPTQVNLEGFSVRKLGRRLVAAWGDRGAGPKPGTLWWGFLDLAANRVTGISSAEITVPFPAPSDPNTRHIADLKLDADGVVWASATHDAGDAGPFVSAVYTLGTLCVTETEIGFKPNTDLTRLWVFPKKVEALELVPGPAGAIAFGSDDENDGGWLLFK